MSIAGKIKHINGAAGTEVDTLQFGASSRSIMIDNVDPTGTLKVSFDKGATFKTIISGRFLSVDVVNSTLVIKSDAGTVNYEILVTLG